MTKRLTSLSLITLAAVGFVACATLSPSADPFVVRVEQTQSTASATFDAVLHVDQADRGFWITNAPAFHQFCEWLRTPMVYQGTNVARCVAMQFNLADLKVAYKNSKTVNNSNMVFTALSTLDAALGQANAWQIIVKTPTKP